VKIFKNKRNTSPKNYNSTKMQKIANERSRTTTASTAEPPHCHSATQLTSSASQKSATSQWINKDDRANFSLLDTPLN
jgi:hypothetical protein